MGGDSTSGGESLRVDLRTKAVSGVVLSVKILNLLFTQGLIKLRSLVPPNFAAVTDGEGPSILAAHFFRLLVGLVLLFSAETVPKNLLRRTAVALLRPPFLRRRAVCCRGGGVGSVEGGAGIGTGEGGKDAWFPLSTVELRASPRFLGRLKAR